MCQHLNVIIYGNSISIEAKISLGRCHAVSYLMFCGGESSVLNNFPCNGASLHASHTSF